MRAKYRRSNIDVFAKFLIILSFFIFGFGFAYQYNYQADSNNNKKGNIRKVQEEGPSVSITPSDGSNVVVNDNGDSSIQPVDSVENVGNETVETGNSNISVPDNNGKTNKINNSNHSQSNTSQSSQQTNSDNDLNYINDQLRNEIEQRYNITIKYGSETEGYTVANIGTESINNASVANNALIRLRNILSLYPEGMFTEIKNGGIPLTIYLVNGYGEENVTGVTDSSYSYANISIAVKYPIEESFYHESYHYIERYMFKKGASFYTWNSLNPDGFNYGTIYNDYSYSNTFVAEAPFVNNYAQTDEREDRASTFEYMMATSKASCLNNGQNVWKKAILMSRTIDAVFDTVSPDVTEYWERFLY